jgi:iron complex outermembrane receptor protein
MKFFRLALTIVMAILASHAGADSVAPEIPITGNPLGVASDDLVTPVYVVNGKALANKREMTLGESLRDLPGMSASDFGPNASRPVIRGMDGDRIRILQNGIGIMDASALSPDHAVAADPFIAEQIEVVRGPATVLYGAGAIGGVVNMIDHRIPKEPLDGVTGRAEARYGGANLERGTVAVVDAGNGLFALHADVYARKTQDLSIPGYVATRASGESRVNRGRLADSDAEANGGALGASLTFDKGYAGLAFSSSANNYGTIVTPNGRIDALNQRIEFASEWHELTGPISRFRARLGFNDYQHVESENAVAASKYLNRGLEGTMEAGHAPIGNLQGVVGLQLENSFLSSPLVSETPLLPSTHTLRRGVYLYEELPLSKMKLSFGTRIDKTSVASNGGDIFGDPMQQQFLTRNASLGAVLPLSQSWSTAFNITHNERAPTANELFIQGAHHATNLYEIGNVDLAKEMSNGIDMQLKWREQANSASVSAYYNQFSNFISLQKTDNINDGLYEALFTGVRAKLYGVEAEGRWRLTEQLGKLDLLLRGDYVRANDSDNGGPLPRIAPARLGFGLDYQFNQIAAKLDVLHGWRQQRTAPNELPTDGYTQVSASLNYALPKHGLELFAKARNLLNQDIRDHTSYIKDIAPQGGRSLMLGIRGEF